MSIRMERMARLLQRELADVIQSEFGQDVQPMVTVTGVRMTKDLSIAYVDVSVFGSAPAQREAALRHLQDRTSQIRGELASRIRHQVRAIPELRFFLDESLEEAQKMEDIFERIRAERERREPES
jgi:ribosome-binding factor A